MRAVPARTLVSPKPDKKEVLLINHLRYVVAVMVAAVLIYSGLWYTAAFQAEKDVVAKLAYWRDQGVRIEHGRIEHGGFPYRITVTVENLELRTRSHGLEFSAKTLLLVSHLWTPNHWIAEARSTEGRIAKGSTRFSDGFMHGSYRLHDNGKTLIVINSHGTDDFKLEKLLGRTPPALEAWELAFWLDSSEQKAESGLYGTRFLDFKITGGTADSKLELHGGISGPLVTDWQKKALAAWRDGGGILEVDTIKYQAPDSQAVGSASFTLDSDFRALGSISLEKAGKGQMFGLIRQEGGTNFMLQNGRITMNGEQLMKLDPVID